MAGKRAHFELVAGRRKDKCRAVPAGMTLRIESLYDAVVHWSTDDWKTAKDTPTRDTGMGVHVADLPNAKLPAGTTLRFTFHWPGAGHWEGKYYEVSFIRPMRA